MDRPDLTGVFDLRGYTSKVLPHPQDEDVVEVIFYKDEVIPVGSLGFRYVDDEVNFFNLILNDSEQGKGILTAIVAETPSAFRKAGFKTWAIDLSPGEMQELGPTYESVGFVRESPTRLSGKIGGIGNLEKTAKAQLKKKGKKL